MLSGPIALHPYLLQRYVWTWWLTISALTIFGMSVTATAPPRILSDAAHGTRCIRCTGDVPHFQSEAVPRFFDVRALGRHFFAGPSGSASIRCFLCGIGLFDGGVLGLSYRISYCLRSAISLSDPFLAEIATCRASATGPNSVSRADTVRIQLAWHAQPGLLHALLPAKICSSRPCIVTIPCVICKGKLNHVVPARRRRLRGLAARNGTLRR